MNGFSQFSICFFLLALFSGLAYKSRPTSIIRNVAEEKTRQLNQNINDPSLNPPPPRRASKIPPERKLYIGIMDREYSPSKTQCSLKSAWIDEILQEDIVDGVELYSNVSYTNEECGISTVTFPTKKNFPMNHDPSCAIMYHMIKMFIERSDAGWFLYVSDGSFVHVKNFISYLKKLPPYPLKENIIKGHCTELRDYFQYFAENSGGIMSRATALALNQSERQWNVACQSEIKGYEAISHALDIIKMYAISNHQPKFLGHPFKTKEDYDALIEQKFDKIPDCPKFYKSLRVCQENIIRMNRLVVWGGESQFLVKSDFLENAKSIIDQTPNKIHFRYDVYQANLCIKNFGEES